MLCRGSNVNIKTYYAHKQKVFKFDESQIIPDILFDENLHLKENFSQNLYASSSVTLLEAVFQHFYVFSTNNGMSKSAMSNALQTEKSHLPQPNSLPPTFKEAKSLIKPLLMPLQKYDACINDCILFRSCDNGNYSDLASCPICQEPRKVKNSSQKVFSLYANCTETKQMVCYQKAPVKVKVALLQFLCDIPAYSKLLHISGHSGLRSCGYCKETGIYCKHLSKTIHLSNRQFLPENHPLRSSNRFSNGSVELKKQPVTYTNEEERHLREIFDNKPNRNQQK
ncbi:Hypothetical predicted protein [Mytilus galloprovincialis]|uniref:Uncharacterized protein n=1 Tax=Mytilus galloprovincialis TaxID=29158 RepID=A0A8B6F5K6_MYTGA|nr:Hypothetical predicted protein [Mytilus galloprovincialis]